MQNKLYEEIVEVILKFKAVKDGLPVKENEQTKTKIRFPSIKDVVYFDSEGKEMNLACETCGGSKSVIFGPLSEKLVCLDCESKGK